MSKHGRGSGSGRGNSLRHLNARQARMFDKGLVLMGQGNHVGGSLLENVGLDAERTN